MIPIADFAFDGLPTRVIFGDGSLGRVGAEVERLGRRRALVLSTPGQAAKAERLAADLGPLAAGVFAGAVMHTPLEATEAALAAWGAAGADCLVALGGGSTIGLGKAIAVRTGADQVAVPTTYAGSEMTDILGETAQGRKTTRRDPAIRPETVIYDVALTLRLPPALTASSGLNALAHAVEALYAPDRNPVLTLLAVEAVGALGAALPVLAGAPGDRAARGRALYGAWLCGAALGGTTMALHHKLCHVLGGSFGLPHAETHAVILPHAAAYNAAAAGALLAPVTEALGGATPGGGALRSRGTHRRAAVAARAGARGGRSRPGGGAGDGGALPEPAAGRAWRAARAAAAGLGRAAAGGMSLAGVEVAVIGAGIGGLAAATALARRGARVRVFERAAALGEVGAGIQIAPNGVAVLAALGLAEAAAAYASVPQAVELRGHRRGGLVARLPLGATALVRYGRPYWQLHRADLLAVLAAGATGAGAELRLGSAVDAVAAGEAGVRVRTADGLEHAAAVAVAADGLRSGLRAAHLAAAPPRFTGHVAWRATVPGERVGPVPAATTVTMGPGRHLVSYPLRGGRLVNLVAVEERAAWAAEGWMAPGDPAELRRAFAGWGGAAGALLAAVEACFLWGLFDHAPLPRWNAGRLVLLGDACHPMLPFLAQGATMALEDAWVLAAALDAAADPAAGLAAYAAARRPRTARVQRAAARSGRLYHLGPGLRAAADLGLGAVAAVAPRLLARRFDWIFAHDVTRAG